MVVTCKFLEENTTRKCSTSKIYDIRKIHIKSQNTEHIVKRVFWRNSKNRGWKYIFGGKESTSWLLDCSSRFLPLPLGIKWWCPTFLLDIEDRTQQMVKGQIAVKVLQLLRLTKMVPTLKKMMTTALQHLMLDFQVVESPQWNQYQRVLNTPSQSGVSWLPSSVHWAPCICHPMCDASSWVHQSQFLERHDKRSTGSVSILVSCGSIPTFFNPNTRRYQEMTWNNNHGGLTVALVLCHFDWKYCSTRWSGSLTPVWTSAASQTHSPSVYSHNPSRSYWSKDFKGFQHSKSNSGQWISVNTWSQWMDFCLRIGGQPRTDCP